MKLFGSLKELVSLVFREDTQEITVRPNQATTYTAARDIQLPPGDSSQVLVSATSVATLTNKTFDADGTGNSISNIENADIKAGAAIDATKIADGTVTSTEFQYIGGLTSDAQTQISAKAAGAASSTDNAISRFDGTTGKIIQNSVGILSDTGVLTGITLDGDDNTVQDLAITSLKTVLADANKVLRRDASGVPQSGNALPNTSAIVTIDSSDILSNKTLASPSITTAALIANQGVLRLYETTGSGTDYVGFRAPASLTTTTTFTLPDGDGSSGQVLSTSGGGTLSWATAATVTNNLYSAKSANYTILDNDNFRTIGVTTSTSTITVTLPVAANNTNRIITVKKLDSAAGVLYLAGSGAETIDGSATVPVPGFTDAITVMSTGSTWVLTGDERRLYRYQHGNTYNGGNAPTITLTGGGGSLSSIAGSSFMPYQDNNGTWHLNGLFNAQLTSVSRGNASFAIAGVTTAAFNQPGYSTSAGNAQSCFLNTSSGTVTISHATETNSSYFVSFDVVLTSKPTWAW